MRRIMLDIETMSTDERNALILSCGAVEFDLYSDKPRFGRTSSWVLEPREQFALGRGTSPNTLKWWSEQSSKAQDAWLCPDPVPIEQFLFELSAMCANADEVWAHGIVFDLGNLNGLNAQHKRNEAVPPSIWKYSAARDCRTMVRVLPVLRQRPTDLIEGPAHDPVADCMTQIWGLWEVWPDLPSPPPADAGPV